MDDPETPMKFIVWGNRLNQSVAIQSNSKNAVPLSCNNKAFSLAIFPSRISIHKSRPLFFWRFSGREGSEFVQLIKLAVSVPPLPEGECEEGELKANGLTAILNEFSETFPTYEFLGTFLEALSDDEEVVQVLSLLMTDDFNNLLNKIGDIDEWVEVSFDL